MGLIVLRVDETIEQEFWHLVPPDTARLHVTRVQSGDDLTPASIAAMQERLKDAAALLPAAADFDVVAYACTSAAALLGAQTVSQQVKAGIQTRAVTDPLTAAIDQIKRRGLSRIGLLSPYVPEVADGLIEAFAIRGVNITASLSLNEKEEAKVVRIGPEAITNAARKLVGAADLDGLFISCTNLNTADLLAPLSQELNLPVLSSNQVLAAHMRALCGL